MRILIIGGNRFFGKRLARNFLETGHDVTLLNRGKTFDGFGETVQRILCDRSNPKELAEAIGHQYWDIIYDQVCFDANEAEAACSIFQDKTDRYVFTSSQSVYGPQSACKEEHFNADNYLFSTRVDRHADYAEAKRQAEATFAKKASFPVVSVRLPIVLGPDDYTDRLKFHVERVAQEKEIFFPNVNAKISFIHSQDAANGLQQIARTDLRGPINLASSLPVRLNHLMATITGVTGKEMILATAANSENHSPYGIETDWYMNTDLASQLEFKITEASEWLESTIQKIYRDL